MGLGDIAPDENRDGGKKYEQFSRDNFEKFLDSHYNWRKLEVEDDPNLKFTKELVYEIEGVNLDGVELRVYSTLDERTNRARGKGKDAIRTVLWDTEESRPCGGRTKTLRIQTWKKNLRPKIDSLLGQTENYVVKCPNCLGFMSKREGKYGEFLGCNSYPACEQTLDIKEWEQQTESL